MSVSEKKLIATSYLLMFLFITLIIPLHLFPCFIAGFLAYEVIISLTPWFEGLVGSSRARWVVVTLIAGFVVLFMTLGIVSLISFLTSDMQPGIDITAETNRIFSDIQNRIPDYFPSLLLPESAEELKDHLFSLVESNLSMIRNISHSFLHGMMTIFIGLIIGAVISLNKPSGHNTYFTQQLLERLHCLSQAFHYIVFAQIKVSLVNTLLTSIMILVLFPLFNVHLPLGKTLIIATFIFGLIPIIGNLISNFMIIISALSISLSVSGLMLLYLILIHKLEYFLNAEIVGNRINAKSWELMLAMLIFEAAFGLEGLVVAPIYYAYLKTELRAKSLI
ncbi:AI-2E family transporter [secondary endosymbiont of Ctenarytaina eucalypti]|uniref:Putative permease n=1 Tax=secondary endosymbiont of Ctenarytaina eucalypti TaxID=1199245 RepID=J3TWU8_9ENTR|nr:AI-2E family transporter [secondary endosymbiont of Ctenarytaina eucalypti]AFP84490.1 putative permease [secondary endosymbiont of Ctenarytaina eucalypti]